MSLYFQETGTSNAPTVVFLHGVGTSGWMWKGQIATLNDFHCLNVDLPGHGRSNHIEWVSLADTASKIAALIEAHATNRRAHIVGLSLGGYIALKLLEHHADMLDRVVMSGVTAAPMPNRILLNPQIWFMSAVMRNRWFLNMQAKALPLTPDEQKAFTENFLAMSMKTTYRRIMEEAAVYHVSESLRHVNTPTLVTAGSKESKIILQSVDTIPKLMPNAEGWLAPHVGHGWNIEAPDLFNRMIRAWITGTSLPYEMIRA